MAGITDLFSNSADKVPKPDDPEVEEQRRRRRLASVNAKGRNSTILAGAGGVEDSRLLGRSVLTGPSA